jgi:hypothetical protein
MDHKTKILDEIRPRLQHKCNLELLDYLAALPNRRLVSISGEKYLRMTGNTERDGMFLPLGNRQAPSMSFTASPEMLESYSTLDGLREEAPPTTGHFVPAAEVVNAGKVLEPEDFPAFQKYSQCPIIFEATNGDQLIQTDEGKFLWCDVGEAKIKKVADSFPRLIKKYVKYRAVGDGQPFDSYGR